MDQQAEKKYKTVSRKSDRTRQKNKRGDSKVESNDSPEIPDRGETSDIPGLPSGFPQKHDPNHTAMAVRSQSRDKMNDPYHTKVLQ